MRERALLLLYCAGAVLLHCSSLSNVAGRGGSETTNGFVACIYHGDGTVASGAAVRLRPSDYVSAAPGDIEPQGLGIDTVTDGSGRLMIDHIPPGSYCVEIKDVSAVAGRGGALLLTFTVGNHDTVDRGNDTIEAFTVIEGSVDTTGAGAGTRYAQVRGLERLERIADNGTFAIHELPAGDLSVRITADGTSTHTHEIANIKTRPGDTSRIRVSGSWTHAQRIYFNTTASGADIASDRYNFPALLRFDSATFNFSSALPRGEDIRFLKADGSPLSYEIEEWNPGAARGAVWVRIDTVFGNSSNRFILMTWGDQGVSSLSSGDAVFDTAQGYVGVWHLSEAATGSAGEIHDATANHLDGQGGGGAADSLTTLVPGLCGPAQNFNGRSSYIRVFDAMALHLDTSFTVSFWVYYRKTSNDNERFISKDGDWSVKENANRPQFTVENEAYLVADTVFAQYNWYHLSVVARDLAGAATASIYVNGEEAGSYENTFPAYVPGGRVTDDHLYFGQHGNGAFFLTGILDEIRIQRTVLSADEIKLMYESQKAGSRLVDMAR